MKRQYRIGIAGFEHMHIVEQCGVFFAEKKSAFYGLEAWRRLLGEIV